jgi:hypothetical protein
MVDQVPPKNDSTKNHLTEVEGWLDAEDQFFEAIDQILRDRITHIARGTRAQSFGCVMWDCEVR